MKPEETPNGLELFWAWAICELWVVCLALGIFWFWFVWRACDICLTLSCVVEMPPSPALRCSPGRELRAESHKRGRSLESGMLFREKDDDLALFNEMQSKERENFLLQSSDDFEDSFCNFLYPLTNKRM